MEKYLKKILWLFTVTILISSCSKEEVIEKNSCMLSKILELYGNESILNKEIEEGIIKF